MFVNDTPFDDSIHTKKLLERIGPIRETHYGGFYDFIPDMAKADTAYTNIALAAHTDTTYFTDPAGLQAFHLLSHTPSPGEPDASGGESLLVDGFHAAKVLRESNERYFKILGRRTLPWHASGNEGVTITPDRQYPVLKLDELGETVRGVRWNADDRGGKWNSQGRRSQRLQQLALADHDTSAADTDKTSHSSAASQTAEGEVVARRADAVVSCRSQVGGDPQEQGAGILVPAEAGNDGYLQQPPGPARPERLHRAEKNLRWLQ